MNNVCLTGRLTKDPTLKYTPQGTPVTEIRLAVNDYDGKDRVDYFQIQIWGGRARAVCDHLDKGRMIEVQGALRLDEWTNNDGERHSRIYVKANRVEFLPDGRKNGHSPTTDIEPAYVDPESGEPIDAELVQGQPPYGPIDEPEPEPTDEEAAAKPAARRSRAKAKAKANA